MRAPFCNPRKTLTLTLSRRTGRGDRRAIAGICLLALTLLTGCIDNSHDVATYRKIIDHGTAPVPVYRADQPLSLKDALLLANADNETIASRGEDFIQALADKMKQAGTFLPTISLQPNYTITHGGAGGFVINGITTGGGQSGSIHVGPTGAISHNFDVPVSASFTGSLANASTLAALGLTVDQRAQLLLDEQQTILLSAAMSYYGAVKAERQAAAYENSVKLKAEKARDQEVRQRLGNVRPLDVAQSQADLAGIQVSLIQAYTDAANNRSALARLIGVTSVDGPLIDDFSPPEPTPPVDAWFALATAQRQDLIAADRAVQAGRQRLDAAIREYVPTVSINFDYFLYYDPRSSVLWTGGVSANVPIFSALAIEADIKSAWSQYRQSGLARSLAFRQVRDDINENHRNLQNSRDKIAKLLIQVVAAQKAYDLAERAYRIGSDTNLDRLTQQDTLLTAQLNLAMEQINEKNNYLGLLRAAGSLQTMLTALPTPAPKTRPADLAPSTAIINRSNGRDPHGFAQDVVAQEP